MACIYHSVTAITVVKFSHKREIKHIWLLEGLSLLLCVNNTQKKDSSHTVKQNKQIQACLDQTINYALQHTVEFSNMPLVSNKK